MTSYIPVRAKKCKFYVNGDTKFLGKNCVINPKRTRDFDSFLQELTNNLKTTRPIRNICTPVNGHRVTNLDAIVQDGQYVALTAEKFKKCGYLELGAGMAHLKGAQSPRNLEVKPVEHSKLWRSSGRIRKIPTVAITIFVYRNGLEQAAPSRVTLTHQTVRYGWDSVFNEVENRLRPTMNGAPKKLCTIDGHTVSDVGELKNMENYVLVCTGDYKGFRKCNYGRTPPPFHTSPRVPRKNYHGVKLDPISKRRTRKDDSDSDSYPNSTATGSSEKTVKSTPIRKPAESRPKPRREPPPKKEEDSVFHAKPVKHKRTPENTRQVDLDKDEGGIFKAKSENRETADEVEDSNDTKVDLPIDQVEAEEVEEDLETYRGHQHGYNARAPQETSLRPNNNNNDVYMGYARAPQDEDETPGARSIPSCDNVLSAPQDEADEEIEEEDPKKTHRAETKPSREATPKKRSPTPKERTPTPPKERTMTPKKTVDPKKGN